MGVDNLKVRKSGKSSEGPYDVERYQAVYERPKMRMAGHDTFATRHFQDVVQDEKREASTTPKSVCPKLGGRSPDVKLFARLH